MKPRTRAVSIIVLTHNNIDYTKACLDALEATAAGHQVVVVDNGSTDGTPAFLQQAEDERPSVRVLLNAHNIGIAAARNLGVAAARNGTVCLLDNDTVPQEGWIEAALEVLDGDVGIVGGKLVTPGGLIQSAGIELREYLMQGRPPYWPVSRFEGLPEDAPEANVLQPVAAVSGSCMFTSKKVWDRVGGMDETFRIARFEDIDFCLTAHEKGFRVMYQPACRVVHEGGVTIESMGDGDDSPAAYAQSNYAALMNFWFEWLHEGRLKL